MVVTGMASPFLLHSHRQSLLRNRWGFECTCSACSAAAVDVNASDTRLEKISSLWPLLLDRIEGSHFDTTNPVPNTTSELADLLVSLAEDERLDAVMLQPYRTAALEWNALGEREKATQNARLAFEYGINSFGKLNSMVRDIQDLIQDPELHWSWKLRLK